MSEKERQSFALLKSSCISNYCELKFGINLSIV